VTDDVPGAPPGARPRVLVVDDNPVDREAARRLLGRGYRVIEAADGDEGLARCAAERPGCVLLDHDLPGTKGVDLIPRFARFGCPVILLTGLDEPPLDRAALEHGAQYYLTKSELTPALLRRTIVWAMERQSLQGQRDAEAAVNRELLAVLEHGMDLTIVFSVEGIIRYANPAVRSVLGYDAGAALVERDVSSLLSPGEARRLREEILPAATERGIWRGELSLESRAEGSVLTEAEVLVARHDARAAPFCALVARDVHESRDMQRRLVEAQKMEAVGRLAGGIAHDFNNLLTVIHTFGDFVAGELGPEHELAPDLQAVLEAAGRAAELTRQLLAFSRREHQALSVVNLGAALSRVESLLRRLIGEDVDLVTSYAEGAGRVCVDVGQLEQVVMNLAVNARDAMPRGGSLTLATSAERLTSADAARMGGEVDPGDFVVLTVSDTGEGMSRSVRERIFEPFFTTKELGKGTGLGLSTVYGIVKQHGGEIEVDSAPGEGTTFHIYLPMTEAPEALVEASESSAPARLEAATILLVEDDSLVRRAGARILGRKGLTVLQASNAGDALAIAQDEETSLDLLLTDVVMPRMNGFELAQKVRALHPEIAVVYMSGYTADAVREHGTPAPGDAMVTKPFLPEVLVAAMADALPRRKSRHAPTRRLLVVDDEARFRRAMRRYLSEHGYEVSEAGGVDEARALLERAAGDFDAVLCDLDLGEGSGMELYDWLRREAQWLAPRFYLVSGGVLDRAAAEFAGRHPGRFVRKPVDPGALEAMLRHVDARP